MGFEWDEVKRQTNIAKHSLDFLDAVKIFDGYTITLEDDRIEYGERRYNTLGMLANFTILFVVHTYESDDVIRIISARKATKREQQRYFA